MKQHVFAAIFALSLCTSVHAAGQDDAPGFYAGLATGKSKSTLENPEGERFGSTNCPLPVKLYAGIDLNRHLAVEAGFTGAVGKYTFDTRLYGTATEPRLVSHALYLAAKGTVAASARIDLHAKLGVAHSRFAVSDAGASNRTISGARPMVGIGAA